MLFSCIFGGFFKRRSYTLNPCEREDYGGPAATYSSLVFPKEQPSLPALVHSRSALSPMLWRHIFPASPAHPSDSDYGSSSETPSSRTSSARSSSSTGYCGSCSSDGADAVGAEQLGASPSAHSAEIQHYSKETSPVAVEKRVGFWPEADFTPDTAHDSAHDPALLTPDSLPPITPFRACFARNELRKRSLRRRPLPTPVVGGRVKAMITFFESDSERVKMPLRLHQTSPDLMRSCPTINFTPNHTKDERKLLRAHSLIPVGVSKPTMRCTRCIEHVRCTTPPSRRSVMI